jgi:8-oxo-dGTP pyrophosphatase MutT (NUDIX family)
MAQVERSAGVIVFHRDRDGSRRYLVLDYGRHWDYAKGHVEPGESDQIAAIRELEEETGIVDVKLMPGFAHEIAYFFRTKRGLVRKTVVFFLAEATHQNVTLSNEHVGFTYLPYDQAIGRVTFPTSRAILELADNFLGTI